jgi:hypothetical protein
VFKGIETFRDIALNEPDSTFEFDVNHLLGRVTPFTGSKPVGIFQEERFIKALENHLHCFLNNFLSRVGNLKGVFFVLSWFRDKNFSRWAKVIFPPSELSADTL